MVIFGINTHNTRRNTCNATIILYQKLDNRNRDIEKLDARGRIAYTLHTEQSS